MQKRTLDILVTTYNEPVETIQPLLNSIALQQNIDFDEIGVIICNDGGTTKIPVETLDSLPYYTEQHICEHAGVSSTRNACLEYSNARYVMFCDCDDLFYSVTALWIIFREIYDNGGFDGLISKFIEETRDSDGNVAYINRESDRTFVHGKIWKTAYLKKNKIQFNPALTIHEDSYFVILATSLSTKIKYCPTPLYLWRWVDESVCRRDILYLNKTYVNMLDSNTALIEQLLSRRLKDLAQYYTAFMCLDLYWNLQTNRWWETDEGHEYLEPTEKRFKEYWEAHKYLYEQFSNNQQAMAQLVSGLKQRFTQEGVILEKITFDQWIQHIEGLE